MREILAALFLVAACTADDAPIEPGTDAGPAPFMLIWTCVSDCGGPFRPDLTRTDSLEIAGLALRYFGGDGPWGAVHAAAMVDGGCYGVLAGDEPRSMRRGYQFCPGGAGFEADIQWISVDTGARPLWRVQAWR